MSNTIYKKALCLILCLCMTVLCACAETETPGNSADITESTDSKPDVSKDASAWVDGIDDAGGKYKGKTFHVITCVESMFYDDSETPIAKAVMERNGLIEQKLGVALSYKEETAEKLEKNLRNALKEGKSYADMICAPANVLARLASEGLLENLYSLPYVDYESGYIDSKALAEQTAGNTLYMFSDLITMDIGSTVGLFYNKKLLGSAGIDPFELAYNGSWTWADLVSMASAVAADEVYAIDSLLSDEELLAAVYTACGGSIIGAGADGAAAAFDDSVANTAMSYVRSLFGNKSYCANFGEEDLIKTFNDGNIAFVVAKLDNVSLFDGAKQEWGLVPMPKLSTSQADYNSMVSGSTMAIAVPKNTEDSAFAGAVLNAFFAASDKKLETALKQTYVNYHFWSNNAALMLDRIAKTARTDLGVLYSSLEEVAAVGVKALAEENITPLGAEKLSAFRTLAGRLFK